MSDLIDRQDAKDVVDMELDAIDHVPEWVYDRLLTALDKVPSEQPELAQNLHTTCTDAISRQTAISAICNACGKIDCDKMDKCEKLQLPPANSSEIPNNSDTISRQAAIDEISKQQTYKMFEGEDTVYIDANDVRSVLVSLPSAQPERKIGKWGDHGECPFCSYLRQWEDDRFCGNCGADMREGDAK